MLHFTVLHGCITEQIIQFNSFIGSNAIFILRRLGTDPEIYVIEECFRVFIFDSLEDDIRVSVVECAIAFLGPGVDSEFGIVVFITGIFNSPYLDSFGFACACPVCFCFGGCLFFR